MVANNDYVGEGYSTPTESGPEAIASFAKLKSIFLDPVYSAKGRCRVHRLIRKGHFKMGERVMFLHAAGSAALFGYTAAFDFADRWTGKTRPQQAA